MLTNTPAPPSPPDRFSPTKRFELAFVVCLAATMITEALHSKVATTNLVMIYLLAVLLVAANLGRVAALAAAVLSVGLFDFLYVPPRFSFAINNFQYLITLAVMLATALVTANLAASLRERAREAQRREEYSFALYDLSRELSGPLTWAKANDCISRFLLLQLQAESVLLLANANGQLEPLGDAPIQVDPHLALVAFKSRELVRNDKDRGMGYATVYLPLGASAPSIGVLALRFDEASEQEDGAMEALALAQTVASIVSVVFERLRFAEAAQAAAVETQTERLRNSILSALSHDVRTPLTAMVGLADSLFLIKPPLPPNALETAQALREQAERLAGMVSNLLEMARLNAGDVQLRREWQPIEEVIGASLKLMGASLAEHPLKLSLAPELPLVHIDAVLMERVICNLLDNAAKYSPGGSEIELTVRRVDDAVEVSVADHGSGFGMNNTADLFRMFVRGAAESTAFGTGLGMAICKSIVDAHGGAIIAENRAAGGAEVRFTIPVGDPPTVEEETS